LLTGWDCPKHEFIASKIKFCELKVGITTSTVGLTDFNFGILPFTYRLLRKSGEFVFCKFLPELIIK
jgi:hypothetical protein